MKLILLKCYKNKSDVAFFVNDKKFELEELCSYLKEQKIECIEFETIENDRVLMNGFLFQIEKQNIAKQIQEIGKAKILK